MFVMAAGAGVAALALAIVDMVEDPFRVLGKRRADLCRAQRP
jgi:hypothetical protein